MLCNEFRFSRVAQYSGIAIVYTKPEIFNFAAAMFRVAVCYNVVYGRSILAELLFFMLPVT